MKGNYKDIFNHIFDTAYPFQKFGHATVKQNAKYLNGTNWRHIKKSYEIKYAIKKTTKHYFWIKTKYD